MEFTEKARIRLEHWISHSEHHHEEYDAFVDQLEQAGKQESANYVRQVMEISAKGTEYLRKALQALD